jgi:hypothetical protein
MLWAARQRVRYIYSILHQNNNKRIFAYIPALIQ